MLHVGQRVEVINASNGFADCFTPFPLNLGAITIVRKVGGIDGEGVKIDGDPQNRFWSRTRFRPVVERKTDTGMAIFRKLLTPATREVERA